MFPPGGSAAFSSARNLTPLEGFEIAAMNRSKANRSAIFCMHLNRDSSEI